VEVIMDAKFEKIALFRYGLIASLAIEKQGESDACR
jgi:hypothetical protein